MKIAFGNDHAGFVMREPLFAELQARGHEILDLGAQSTDSVDFPDFARAACEAVARGEADRAVLVCGTGVGISIAANKVKGIRCALCHDDFDAEMSRRHNNANALALRGRNFAPEVNRRLLGIWLDTPYDDEERHTRRIGKIAALEEC